MATIEITTATTKSGHTVCACYLFPACEWSIKSQPGPLCPGPGVYRLVSEEKIGYFIEDMNKLWADGEFQESTLARIMLCLRAAGLGKENENAAV